MMITSRFRSAWVYVVTRRREHFIIAGIFITAFVIRSIGIGWGLPNQNYPYSLFLADEPNVLYATLLFGKRIYQLTIVRNQPFFYLVSFLVFCVYYVIGRATGHFSNLIDFQAQYLQDNSQFLLVGRYFVVFAASLTVVLTYFVGRKMFGKREGLFAALFLLFSFGHVVYSKIFRLDSFLPLIFLLAFYLIINLVNVKPKKLKPFVLCGLVMGFAAATKITGFALLVPFLLVPFVLNKETSPRQFWKPKLDRRYPFALFVYLAAVFALTAPSFFLKPSIAEGVARRLDHSGSSGYLPTLSPYEYSLPWHFFHILPQEVGIVIYLLALFGILIMLIDKRNRTSVILFLATMIAFLLPIGYLIRTTWRDMLPMLPFFAIAAGYALARLLDLLFLKVQSLKRGRLGDLTTVILLVLLLALPAANIYRQKRLILSQDTRDIAQIWIEINVPEGSQLAIEPYGPAVLDRTIKQLVQSNVTSLGREVKPNSITRPVYDVYLLDYDLSSGKDNLQPDLLLPYLIENEIDYVVVSSAYYGRFYNDAVDIVFPEPAANGREFHDILESNLELVTQFTPKWWDIPGPKIKVYKVPKSMPLESETIFGSFEPFTGMEHPASAVGYYQFSPR
jgi:hypothetical protein